MKSIEATGKTRAEAVASGLAALRARPEEVDQEVIVEVPEETRVRITIKEPRQYLHELTNYLLNSLGFRTTINVNKDEHGFYISVHTRQYRSLLIGKNGETLKSLQYLVSRLAKRFYSNINVLVDVNDYRMKRVDFLNKKAEAVANIVIATKREMALDPMTKREEEMVTERLRRITGIKVYSIGKGPNRSLIIAPGHESG